MTGLGWVSFPWWDFGTALQCSSPPGEEALVREKSESWRLFHKGFSSSCPARAMLSCVLPVKAWWVSKRKRLWKCGHPNVVDAVSFSHASSNLGSSNSWKWIVKCSTTLCHLATLALGKQISDPIFLWRQLFSRSWDDSVHCDFSSLRSARKVVAAFSYYKDGIDVLKICKCWTGNWKSGHVEGHLVLLGFSLLCFADIATFYK